MQQVKWVFLYGYFAKDRTKSIYTTWVTFGAISRMKGLEDERVRGLEG